MDQLTAMRVFIAVAEAGGFAPAARTLGMSTSAVSRHVAELESHLATALLHRTTRRLSLTEAGAAYLSRAGCLIDELSALDAEMAAYSSEPSGRLRISASPTFGDFVLAPIAAEFAKAYPRVRLELEFTERLVDVVAEGYDAVLRAGKLRDSSLRSRKLFDLEMVPCASPEYLAERGEPQHPSDLAHHDCVHWRWRDPSMIWSFRKDGEVIDVEVTGRFLVYSLMGEREGARAGLGVALLSPFLIEDDLRSGRLVRILKGFERVSHPITLLWPPGPRTPRKLRVFIDFLVEALHKLDGVRVDADPHRGTPP